VVTRKQNKPTSNAVLITGIGVAGALAGLWWNLPAFAILWLALLIAAFSEPYPELTGKRAGVAVPASASEVKLLRRYRFFNSLRIPLLIPGKAWLPDKTVPACFVGGIGAALIGVGLPAAEFTGSWGRPLNAYCGFTLGVFFIVWRQTRDPHTPMPDVGFRQLPQMTKAAKTKVGLIIATTVPATILGLALAVLGEKRNVPVTCRWIGIAGFIIVGLATGAWAAYGKTATEQWRNLVDRRVKYWEPILDRAIKTSDPLPVLLRTETIGAATVDTFDLGGAPATKLEGHEGYLLLSPQVCIAGMDLCVLPGFNVDDAEKPVTQQIDQPGTLHPSRIRIVTWNEPQIANLADETTSEAAAGLAIEVAISKTLSNQGWQNPIFVECQKIGDSPVFATRWQTPHPRTGVPELSTWTYSGTFETCLGVPFLVDPDANVIYVGVTPYSEIDEDAAKPFAGFNPKKHITQLFKLKTWNDRWSKCITQAPPVPQWVKEKTHKIGDKTINELSFVTFQGVPISVYMKAADTLTTMMGGAKTVSVLHFCLSDGVREDLGITVAWSDATFTTPTSLPDVGKGSILALRVMLAKAFDAVRMPRPEICSAKAWTAKNARKHVWQIELNLMDGVTLANLRAKSGNLADVLKVEWLRLETGGAGKAWLYVGADPNETDLAPGAVTQTKIDALNWDHAWVACKVVNKSGVPPKRVSAKALAGNENITLLDFELPPGIGPKEVDKSWAAVETAVACAYSELTFGHPKPGMLQVMTSKGDPLPSLVGFDWDWTAAHPNLLPLGVTLDGSWAPFDRSESPHVLVAGTTGAGKSVAVQGIVAAACFHGWDIYITDPSKRALDFRFIEPWAKSITPRAHDAEELVALAEAQAMLQGVYAECGNRKKLRGDNGGVGKIEKLPAEIRPAFAIVVVDEFTSLITVETPPPKSDDPDVELERELVLQKNAYRAKIGSLIGRIAREARSEGIMLLLATQALRADTLKLVPSDLKTNLARILLGNSTFGDRASAFRNPEKAPNLAAFPKGRGLWESISGGIIPIHTPYNPGEGEYLARILAAKRQPVTEKLDISPWLNIDAPEAPPVLDLTELELPELVFDLLPLEEPEPEPEPVQAPTEMVETYDNRGRLFTTPVGDAGKYGHKWISALAIALTRADLVSAIVPEGELAGTDPLTEIPWTAIAQELCAKHAVNLNPPEPVQLPEPPVPWDDEPELEPVVKPKIRKTAFDDDDEDPWG